MASADLERIATQRFNAAGPNAVVFGAPTWVHLVSVAPSAPVAYETPITVAEAQVPPLRGAPGRTYNISTMGTMVVYAGTADLEAHTDQLLLQYLLDDDVVYEYIVYDGTSIGCAYTLTRDTHPKRASVTVRHVRQGHVINPPPDPLPTRMRVQFDAKCMLIVI